MRFCGRDSGGREVWDNLALVADSSGASVRLKSYLPRILFEHKHHSLPCVVVKIRFNVYSIK